MNLSYLQFVFAMVLVINGILCDSDQEMLHCGYSGNDVTERFTVAAGADDNEDVSLDVNANITCTSNTTDEEFSFNIECPVEWRILLQISSIDRDIVVEAFDHDGEGEHSISSENHPSNYPLFILSKNDILEIKATYSDNRMRNRAFMLSVWTVKVIEQIGPDSSCQVNQTSSDPGSTCEGRCDTGYEPDLSCQCNGRCQDFDNCCEDYMDKCLIEDPGSTCEGRCDTGYEPDLSCQCNGRCQDFDNCCEDYMEICLNEGNGARTIEVTCPINSSSDDVLVSFEIKRMGPPWDGYLTFICTRLDEQSFDADFSQSIHLGISCKHVSNTLSIIVTARQLITISNFLVETIVFDRDSSLGSETANPRTTVTSNGPSQPTFANPMTTVKTNGSSQPNSGKSNSASIVVPIVVVLVAVFLIVALAATIWRKRRNKQASPQAENVSAHNGPYLHYHVSSEGGDATDKSPRYVTSNAGPEGDGTVALNIRSAVNQNEDRVVYNEIGDQDYNTLFGGKEKDDYHEYNVPDRPQGKTSVDRTTASGSGPYQELFQDETHAVAAVNRSPEVTGTRHGVADDRHAYQDLRQDKRSVSGVNPNGEIPNKLPTKDTPATENGYQALQTATLEYATLEPSPEYATLEQHDQSMTGTSDVSGPPADKQYDTLQRSINTVGQPPSAGYGTLKPMHETDADYEYPNVKPKTTSDFDDATRPTVALPINQSKARHSVSYDDDDYQTPIKPAEDLMNAYQTLDNPGYQQEPDTQDEEYSHLQRSLGAKPQSHPSSNQDNSDSYGKLHLNGTP